MIGKFDSNELDYSFNAYKKKEDNYIENKKEQYNPYVNNEGSVMGKD
jgi:hypothetical protein